MESEHVVLIAICTELYHHPGHQRCGNYSKQLAASEIPNNNRLILLPGGSIVLALAAKRTSKNSELQSKKKGRWGLVGQKLRSPPSPFRQSALSEKFCRALRERGSRMDGVAAFAADCTAIPFYPVKPTPTQHIYTLLNAPLIESECTGPTEMLLCVKIPLLLHMHTAKGARCTLLHLQTEPCASM